MSVHQRSSIGGWQKWLVSGAVVLGALLLAFGGTDDRDAHDFHRRRLSH